MIERDISAISYVSDDSLLARTGNMVFSKVRVCPFNFPRERERKRERERERERTRRVTHLTSPASCGNVGNCGARARPNEAGHDNPSLSIGTQLPTWQWQTPGITSEMLHIATGLANQIRFHTSAREDASDSPARLLPAGSEIRCFATKMSARDSLPNRKDRTLLSGIIRIASPCAFSHQRVPFVDGDLLETTRYAANEIISRPSLSLSLSLSFAHLPIEPGQKARASKG